MVCIVVEALVDIYIYQLILHQILTCRSKIDQNTVIGDRRQGCDDAVNISSSNDEFGDVVDGLHAGLFEVDDDHISLLAFGDGVAVGKTHSTGGTAAGHAQQGLHLSSAPDRSVRNRVLRTFLRRTSPPYRGEVRQ